MASLIHQGQSLALKRHMCTDEEISLKDYNMRKPNRAFQMHSSIRWTLVDGDNKICLPQMLCLSTLVKARSYTFRFPTPVPCGDKLLVSYYRIYFIDDRCHPSRGFHHVLCFSDGTNTTLLSDSNRDKRHQWYLVSLSKLERERYWENVCFSIVGFVKGQLLVIAEEQYKSKYHSLLDDPRIGGEINSVSLINEDLRWNFDSLLLEDSAS